MDSSKNADCASFVNHVNPWFDRGGAYDFSLDSGPFAFGSHSGSVYEYVGFRVVLRTIFQISLR